MKRFSTLALLIALSSLVACDIADTDEAPLPGAPNAAPDPADSDAPNGDATLPPVGSTNGDGTNGTHNAHPGGPGAPGNDASPPGNSDGAPPGDDWRDWATTAVDTAHMAATPGPAEALYIDGTVHAGGPWSGKDYEGLRGDNFDFHMADYPLTWAIATVHASMLFQSRGFSVAPNAVLAMSLRASGLQCANGAQAETGCFALDTTRDYPELFTLFPEHFSAPHAAVIGAPHFEASALALFFHWLALDALFGLHTADSPGYFARHPDPNARFKTLLVAEIEGSRWPGLADIFSRCAGQDILDCCAEQPITVDHVQSVRHYTSALNNAAPYDPLLTADDLRRYFAAIQVLYPQVDAERMDAWLAHAFDTAASGEASVSFQQAVRPLLVQLMRALPPVPDDAEVLSRACQNFGHDMLPSACP